MTEQHLGVRSVNIHKRTRMLLRLRSRVRQRQTHVLSPIFLFNSGREPTISCGRLVQSKFQERLLGSQPPFLATTVHTSERVGKKFRRELLRATQGIVAGAWLPGGRLWAVGRPALLGGRTGKLAAHPDGASWRGRMLRPILSPYTRQQTVTNLPGIITIAC